jgi:hypothetical protein
MQRLAPITPRVVPGRVIAILAVAQDWRRSREFARIDLGAPVEAWTGRLS